jgi:hypothetical protein
MNGDSPWIWTGQQFSRQQKRRNTGHRKDGAIFVSSPLESECKLSSFILVSHHAGGEGCARRQAEREKIIGLSTENLECESESWLDSFEMHQRRQWQCNKPRHVTAHDLASASPFFLQLHHFSLGLIRLVLKKTGSLYTLRCLSRG